MTWELGRLAMDRNLSNCATAHEMLSNPDRCASVLATSVLLFETLRVLAGADSLRFSRSTERTQVLHCVIWRCRRRGDQAGSRMFHDKQATVAGGAPKCSRAHCLRQFSLRQRHSPVGESFSGMAHSVSDICGQGLIPHPQCAFECMAVHLQRLDHTPPQHAARLLVDSVGISVSKVPVSLIALSTTRHNAQAGLTVGPIEPTRAEALGVETSWRAG